MWAPIIKSVLAIAEKIMDAKLFASLMNNANEIEKLEKQLALEYAKPLDLQDDLVIPALEDELQIVREAFLRQVQLGAGHAKPN